MKKLMMLWFAAVALVLGAGTDLAAAQNHGFHGNGGGFHGGGMNHGGGQQARHGFRRFHDFHGHIGIIIGGPFFWPPSYYDPAFYPGATSLMYVPPGENYSYYCNNPVGYYPDVSNCPSGWWRVAPGDSPN